VIILRIAGDTGLDSNYVRKVVRTANYRYRTYYIPKRTEGKRKISHPSPELKLLQRWVVENVFTHFPVHDSVYSYRKGRGIVHIANKHKKYRYFLRLDFIDFFHSIRSKDVVTLIQKHLDLLPIKLSSNDLHTISSIVCMNGCLTIGAPSSPTISNAILYDFDKLWHEKAKMKNAIYTRYADDIYFSTNKSFILKQIYNEFKIDLDKMKSPKLHINEDKTVFTSKKYRRMITGLVITSDKKVSIGRKRKRHIKGMIHRFTQSKLNEKEVSYLNGFLAYINAVEPEFLESLKMKFGQKIIDNISSSEIVKIKS